MAKRTSAVKAARLGSATAFCGAARDCCLAHALHFLRALARQLAVAALLDPGRRAADDHADGERQEQEDEQRQLVSVSAGLPGLNGSSVKATNSRLATASAIRMMASGTKIDDEHEAVDTCLDPVNGRPACAGRHLLFRVVAVQPFAQFLAGLEERHPFSSTSTDLPVRGLRPVRAGRFFTEKAPKPRSSTRSAVGQRLGDLLENRADDIFDVAKEEMGIARWR